MLRRVNDAAISATGTDALRQRVLVSPASGSSRCVRIAHVAADANVNAHWQIGSEQIHYTIRGSARYRFGDEVLEAESGTALAVPPDTTVSLGVGPKGWECLTATCGECAYRLAA